MSTPYTANITLEDNLTVNNSIVSQSLYDSNTGTGPGPIAFDDNQVTLGDSSKVVNAKRAEITDYIRLRLGDGIVDVELDKEHYELAINQALIKYRQKAQNSQEESYAFLDLRHETQEYILPNEIMEVRQIFRRGIGSVTGTTASQFEPFASGYLNTYMLVAGRVGGLLNYELFTQYQELAMRMFGGHMNFTFNRVTKKLTIVRKMPYRGVNSAGDISETVLLHTYNFKPDIMLLNDHMAFPWLQEYAYSFAKRIVGEAREKFNTIAGPQGGTSLNGAALKSEAQAEMDALEQQLKDYVDGSMPLTWIVG
jgi:hypothetical protein